MGKYLLNLLIIICCYSCKDFNRNAVSCLVNKWEGKTIILPSNLSCISYNNDLIQVSDSIFNKYVILTYVDSVNYHDVELQLSKWKELAYVLDSISDDSISFVFSFFYNERNRKELVHMFEENKFTSMVYVDLNDSLNYLNQFPNEPMFRTFLMDRNRKVIAIGNPIQDPKVKELYLSIIKEEKITESEAKSLTVCSVDHLSIDLGKFNWKQAQSAEFVLTNEGDIPLIIIDVSPSCGCISVEYSNKPILPRKQGKIIVNYKMDQPEYFSKTITVHCNVSTSPIQLKITGTAQ